MLIKCGFCHHEEEVDEDEIKAQTEAVFDRVGDRNPNHTFAVCDTCAKALVANGALNPALIQNK